MKVSPHPVSGVLTRGRKLGHRDTQEGMTRAKEAGDGLTHLHTEDRQGSWHLEAGARGRDCFPEFSESVALSAPRFQNSCLQSCETTDFSCGDLLLIQSAREQTGLCRVRGPLPGSAARTCAPRGAGPRPSFHRSGFNSKTSA